MTTKLIILDENIFIEVEALPNELQQISGGLADKVNATFEKIQPILLATCKPIIAAWQELDKDMNVEGAEVEIGFSFEGEGNLYVTKSKATANILVKLILKPKLS